MENYGYGLKSDSPNTPWNEKEPPVKTLECQVTQKMIKFVGLDTTDYNVVKEPEVGVEYDFSDTDLENEFSRQHLTIQELLFELKKYVEHDISMSQVGRQRKRLKWILDELKGWECESFLIEEQ
jgi:hypothetical protein